VRETQKIKIKKKTREGQNKTQSPIKKAFILFYFLKKKSKNKT
jgi:hypothetical protein